MDFNNKFDGVSWQNDGSAPSPKLQEDGFAGGYKPPASVFNWFWGKVMKAITEIQTKLSTDGFAAGRGATATTGGAVGSSCKSTDGFAGGTSSEARNGGAALGKKAFSSFGAAVGNNAKAANGAGAVGNNSVANGGGAIGNGAKAGKGFSGGENAVVISKNQAEIDAIQLGTGTNENEKTLQVYDHTLMNADGTIPQANALETKMEGKLLGKLDAETIADSEVDSITKTGVYYVSGNAPYYIFHQTTNNGNNHAQIKLDGDNIYRRTGALIENHTYLQWTGWVEFASKDEVYTISETDTALSTLEAKIPDNAMVVTKVTDGTVDIDAGYSQTVEFTLADDTEFAQVMIVHSYDTGSLSTVLTSANIIKSDIETGLVTQIAFLRSQDTPSSTTTRVDYKVIEYKRF